MSKEEIATKLRKARENKKMKQACIEKYMPFFVCLFYDTIRVMAVT